jgi:vancomycin aglycone glucosyltransferase
MAGLAMRLREFGAEVAVAAPADFAELLDRAGVRLVPLGQPIRQMVAEAKPGDFFARVGVMMAAHHSTLVAAAEGCDALVATGSMPSSAAARSVTDALGIRYVHASFHQVGLPSPYHRPVEWPGRPLPADVTDNRVLWGLDVENMNALFGKAFNDHRVRIGLPPVDNVRDHVLTDHPWLAADPLLCPWLTPADLDVVQTGAWILPDERPLPAELVAFLDAGEPPVYVGFGSMRAPKDIARVAIDAVRAHGRRVVLSRGWADLALIDDLDDCLAIGEVNQQALFRRVAAVVHHGGSGTTAAARAGVPQAVVPQVVDQPYTAARVAELGIGAAHDGPTPTTESLSAALKVALDPRTRERASAVAGTIRNDGTTVAANLLLEREG